MKWALVIVLATTTAVADDKLGFQLGAGGARLGDAGLSTVQLGIGLEHRIAGKLRALAEYDLLWIGSSDAMDNAPPTSGHRASLGVRRRIARKLIFYADVQAGAGLGLYDTRDASFVAPHAFAGLRGGYRLALGRSPGSRAFETAVDLRALAFADGYGFVATFGFYWDDDR